MYIKRKWIFSQIFTNGQEFILCSISWIRVPTYIQRTSHYAPRFQNLPRLSYVSNTQYIPILHTQMNILIYGYYHECLCMCVRIDCLRFGPEINDNLVIDIMNVYIICIIVLLVCVCYTMNSNKHTQILASIYIFATHRIHHNV